MAKFKASKGASSIVSMVHWWRVTQNCIAGDDLSQTGIPPVRDIDICNDDSDLVVVIINDNLRFCEIAEDRQVSRAKNKRYLYIFLF